MRHTIELKRTTMYPAKVNKIEELMKAKGINQSDLAELSGLSTSTISLVLCTGLITRKTAVKLADGLGVEARSIAVFPRNKKTAEAVTPAVDAEQVCIEDTLDDTTTDAVCQSEDKLYFYEGEWRTEKRVFELLTIDKVVELLNLPVIAITRVR